MKSSLSAYNISLGDKPFFKLLDTNICNEESIMIGPNNNLWQYQWSDGRNVSPVSFDSSGIYVLTASNFCGSYTDTSVFNYLRCNLDFENAFTPNNDGLNDVFNPIISGYELKSMLIYNRWGELVYSQNGIGKGWDGNFKGQKAQQDIYTYQLIYLDALGQEQRIVNRVILLR